MSAEEQQMALHADARPKREARRAPVPQLPKTPEEFASLAAARAAVQGCRRCDLYKYGTQAVFGEGPEHAAIMFVGEQPGDQEDLQGRPFVGPAGRIFDKALEKVGIERDRVYVTNAVKHFKFQQRGKKRLHQRPNAGEIAACRFWLDLERRFVRPDVVVAMGAIAVQSLIGKAATISSLRGKPVPLEDGSLLYVTIHPSYLLRIRENEDWRDEERRFEEDLARVRDLAREHARPGAARREAG